MRDLAGRVGQLYTMDTAGKSEGFCLYKLTMTETTEVSRKKEVASWQLAK